MNRGSQPENPNRMRRKKILSVTSVLLILLILGWLTNNWIILQSRSNQPVDALLVLGGSIRREMYVAELAKQYPNLPILIAHGSPDPCIFLLFKRAKAPLQNVLLEKCSSSTFDNFYFSLPILQQWQVKKVKVITSATHLPRAKWMAQILFGARGIWADVEVVPETGIPGNQESCLKTGLDVTRSLMWTLFSGAIQPQCSQLIQLTDVDMESWNQQGFKCEHQGGLDLDSPQ